MASAITKRASDLKFQANAAGVRFVITELQTSLLFLHLADTSQDKLRRRRAVLIAGEAHQVALNCLERIVPTRTDGRTIDRLLHRVERTLADHGI